MVEVGLTRLTSGINGEPYGSNHDRQYWFEAIDEAGVELGKRIAPLLKERMAGHVDYQVSFKAGETLIKMGSEVDALRGLYPLLDINLNHGGDFRSIHSGHPDDRKMSGNEQLIKSMYQSNPEGIRKALLYDCRNTENSRKAVFILNFLEIEEEECTNWILHNLNNRDPRNGIKMYQDALTFPHLMKNERLKEGYKKIQEYAESSRSEEWLRKTAVECLQRAFSPQPAKKINMPESIGGLEAITYALNTSTGRAREEAVNALGKYQGHPKSEKASEMLIDIIKKDSNENLRRSAAKSLGNFGKQGVEQLLALHEEGSEVVVEALYVHGDSFRCYPEGPIHDQVLTGEKFDEQSGHTLYHIHCSNCNRKLDHWNDEY